MNIMFVCTGNTCRSPMAEALMSKLAEASGDGKIAIASCGTDVYEPSQASANAVAVMGEMGIDLSGHLSQRLTRKQLEEADLVLTMTSYHKAIISAVFPGFEEKVYTLCEYAYNGECDISDPYGGDVKQYRACAEQLKDAVEKIYSRIKSNGGKV